MQSTKLSTRSKVSVKVSDIMTDELIAEFESIHEASNFIRDVANNKLGRIFKNNKYIRSMIGHESRGVLKDLGFKTVCSFKCDHCKKERSGRPNYYDPERLNRNLCEHCHISIEQKIYEDNT